MNPRVSSLRHALDVMMITVWVKSTLFRLQHDLCDDKREIIRTMAGYERERQLWGLPSGSFNYCGMNSKKQVSRKKERNCRLGSGQ